MSESNYNKLQEVSSQKSSSSFNQNAIPLTDENEKLPKDKITKKDKTQLPKGSGVNNKSVPNTSSKSKSSSRNVRAKNTKGSNKSCWAKLGCW